MEDYYRKKFALEIEDYICGPERCDLLGSKTRMKGEMLGRQLNTSMIG